MALNPKKYMSNTDVMISLLLNIKKDKKDVKKLLLKLSNRANPAARDGLIARLLAAKNYREEFDKSLREMLELDLIRIELLKENYTGFSMVGSLVYPVMVTAGDDESLEWAKTHEKELTHCIANATFQDFEPQALVCTISLFMTQGYSGKSINWTPYLANHFNTQIQQTVNEDSPC